jgi:hypothetical protein
MSFSAAEDVGQDDARLWQSGNNAWKVRAEKGGKRGLGRNLGTLGSTNPDGGTP